MATDNTEHRNGVKARLLRGIGANSLNPVVTGIIQLGSVPLLLHAWGVPKYGDWLLLSAIPSYLTFSDLGLGAASGSEMTMRVAANDRDGALESFQSSWALVTGVSFGILVLAVVAIWWLPWQSWLRLSEMSSRQAAEILAVLAAYVALSQQNGILESGFRADGHFATGSLWLTMQRLAENVIATIVALVTGNLLATAFAYLSVAALGVLGYATLLRRLSPWISYRFDHVCFDKIRQLAAPAFGFMVIPLAYALSFQGLTIVVGDVLGPVAVVSFTTLRTMARLSVQLVTVIKHGVWPELSRAFGAGDIALARRLHRSACQASLLISLLGGSFLWLAGPTIYRLWVSRNVVFSATCFHVFLGVVIASCLWETSAAIPMSVNGHFALSVAYCVVNIVSLALAWGLAHPFGTSGAAVGSLIGESAMAVLVMRTSLSLVGDSPIGFVTNLFTMPDFLRRPSFFFRTQRSLEKNPITNQ